MRLVLDSEGMIQRSIFMVALVGTLGIAQTALGQGIQQGKAQGHWQGKAQGHWQGICPKCGKVHSQTTPTISQPVMQTSYASPMASQPIQSFQPVQNFQPAQNRQPVQNFQPAQNFQPSQSSGLVPSSGGTQNVLAALNGQRARQGIGALMFDPTLQAVAQRRAQQMASSGLKSHPPGSYAPGRYEGVGWSSSYTPGAVMACYTSDPNMRAAGAAMATGRDGVYFAVVYR